MSRKKLLALLLTLCLALPMFVVTSLADDITAVAAKALLGDANDDGVVDTRDVITTRRYLADLNYDTGSSSIDISINADMNNDGEIRLSDLYLLRCFIVNGDNDNNGGEVIEGNVIVPNVPEDSWGYAFWNVFAESIKGNSDITTGEIVYNFMMSEAGQALGFSDTMDMHEGYLPGFSQDITGFKSATVFTPMASEFAFMGYVFELDSADAVPAFMKTLKANHDLRWMICLTAEIATMGAYDNYVLFVMSPVAMPGIGGGEAEIVYPENAEDNTYAANIWNFFEKEMTFNPTVSAEGIAYALGYSFAVPFEMSEVNTVDTAVENAHFAHGFDYVESIYSITEAGSDVVIYVFSIEQGLVADGWGSYYITGEDVVWGAYNNMLIAIHGANFIINDDNDDNNGGEVVEGNVIVPNVPEDSWGYAFWNVFAESIQGNSDITTGEIVYNFMMSEAGQALGFSDTMDMPEGYLPGFSANITGFKSATVFTPMASEFAFMGYVFELPENADIAKFVKYIYSNKDMRWMICLTAEIATVGAYGNYVLFVMSPVAMPNVGGGEAEIVYTGNAEDGTYAANIWNFFEEEMTFNPTVNAEGMAYAIAYSTVVPFNMADVTAVNTSVANAHFANGFDSIKSIYSITEAGSDVVIYVFSIEQGIMVESWGAYYITGEDVVWGAYNNMLIDIHGGNIQIQ